MQMVSYKRKGGRRMTLEELRDLPKIELHCHLDGSLSKAFIEKRLNRSVKEEELSVSEDCASLVEYLEKFALPGECLRDAKGLEEAGYDVLRTMSEENVIYAEIRFAPLLHVNRNFRTTQVLEALLRGLERGKEEFGVDYNVIVCVMRHHSFEESYEMLKEAYQFLGKGVCAVDLAGAEGLYPMAGFMEFFAKVKALGMPFTLHAGECGEVQNILDSIEAGAMRIGHGIAMRNHPEVQQLVREKEIGVEMCPISNLQTKAVADTTEYPLREFIDAGIPVTINTDNRTVSNTSMTKELEFIQKVYGIKDEEILLLMRNAAKTAFIEEEKKQQLFRKLM